MDKRTGTKTMSTLSSQGDSKWHTNRVIEKNDVSAYESVCNLISWKYTRKNGHNSCL